MKRLRIPACLLLLFFGALLRLQAQNIYLDWAGSMGGPGFDIGRAVALDAQGNAYAAGFFQGTADFDPGPGVTSRTSAGDNDVFVQKLDAHGQLLWARAIGGAAVDEAKGIAVDASGNVYVTGRFSGSVDFDQGPGTAIDVAQGMTDIFLLKLDANGNFVWFRHIGANGADEATAIVASGNSIYTIGYFQGTMDIDPTAGSDMVTSTSGTLDAFIQRLDTSGAYVWGKRFGADGIDYGFGITTDANGHVFATGCFQGTADFDPGVGVSNLVSNVGATSAYVLNLNANGSFQWARQIGVAETCIGYAVSTSTSGAVFVTGGFNGNNMDFDPGSGSDLHTSNAYDVFVQKLDANGIFRGAWTFGGLGDDYGYALDVTPSQEVYFTGGYGATVDFDPGSAVNNISSFNSTFDMYIERMDTSGNFVWARSIGGGGIDYGFGLAADARGHVLTTGCYDLTTDFDTEAGVHNLTTAGNADIFVHQLKQCVPNSASLSLSGCDSLQVNAQTYYSSGTFTQTLTNASGCDSTLTLQLTLGQSNSIHLIDTACFAYTLNAITYDSSGAYTQILTNAAGCDSVLHLQLVIHTVDTSLYETMNYLGANAVGAIYQWLECGGGPTYAPIPGATSRDFFPLFTSYFAVAVTQNGCSDTSSCYPFFNDAVRDAMRLRVHLNPNPTSGSFQLAFDDILSHATIEIQDALGRLIWQGEYQNGQVLHLDGPNGLYFVTVHTEAGSASLKVLKE